MYLEYSSRVEALVGEHTLSGWADTAAAAAAAVAGCWLLAAGCWLLAAGYLQNGHAEHMELVSITQTTRAKHVAELFDTWF